MQQHGLFHGGVTAFLVDNATTIAAATSRGQSALTAEYKLNLLSPAVGERLICRARVIKPGRQVAVVAADVFCVTDGVEKHTATALASIAMILNYLGSDGQTVFTTLILMTGITAAIPYAFSALAQIKWRIADQQKLKTPRFVRDMVVAVLAVVFSAFFIYYSRNTGHSFWVYWGPFVLTAGAFVLGVPVYNSQRRRMRPPGEVAPYR